MEKTKILILAANPLDTARLGLGEEYRKIQEALELSHREDLFEIKYAPDLRDEDIQQKLLTFKPHIVHFSGHGERSGLIFSSENGKSHAVDKNALAALFKLFSQTVHCVILNACYSEDQADVIAEHIRYVIGTTTSIDDEAATKFTTGFYKALFNDQDIPTAFEFGNNAIQLANIPEQYKHKPILKNKQLIANSALSQKIIPLAFTSNPSYVNAYKTDIFVSYVEQDNQTFFGMESGWISTFNHYLTELLQRQLGTQNFNVYFNSDHYAAVSANQAATLLVFASANYLQSVQGKEQLAQFLAQGEKNRVFVVELMPLQLPSYLQECHGYKFWLADENNAVRTLAVPRPNPFELEYYQRLDDLSRQLAQCLKNLNNPPVSATVTGSKTVIFLAEVTEDLEERRNQLKRYLQQQGYSVLPEQFYLFNENFVTLLNEDLKRSQWFVQLLSEQSGRGDYPMRQFEQAKLLLKPAAIFQWHERELDITKIQNSQYQMLFNSGYSVAMNLIEFQAYLNEKLHMAIPEAAKNNDIPYAFVYAAPEDVALAEQVSDILEQQGIMSTCVDFSILNNPAQLCEAIKENLMCCDAFILVYGQIQEKWIKQNLLNAQGKAARRESPLKVAAIVNKKPPLKSAITLNLLNIPLLQCECEDVNYQTLSPIVQALQA